MSRKRELVVRLENGEVVCDACLLADTVPTRMRGLMGRRALEPGSGLLLRPAPSVHTFFMRFAIDVIFAAKDGTVVGLRKALAPWRIAVAPRAFCVIELAAGSIERESIAVGDRLVVTKSD